MNTILVDEILNHLTKEEALTFAHKVENDPTSFDKNIIALACMNVAHKYAAHSEGLQAYEWAQKAASYHPERHTDQIQEYEQLATDCPTPPEEIVPTTSDEWIKMSINFLRQYKNLPTAKDFFFLSQAKYCCEHSDLTNPNNLSLLIQIGEIYARFYSHSPFSIEQLTEWMTKFEALSHKEKTYEKEYKKAQGHLSLLLAIAHKQEDRYAEALSFLKQSSEILQEPLLPLEETCDLMKSLTELSNPHHPLKRSRLGTTEPSTPEDKP